MDFTYTSEQKALRDAVRDLLGRREPSHAVGRPHLDTDLWGALSEMGILSLAWEVADEDTPGAGPVEVMIAAQELGRANAVTPYAEVVTAAHVLAATEEGRALREDLGTGEAVVVPVLSEPNRAWGAPPTVAAKETGDGWRVRGEKPERWVRQTDFSNDEAVGFLADRLNRLGVEERLLELGAQEGDTVLIGDADNAVVFDFKPMLEGGAEILGRRGEDLRFDEERPAARRRREIEEAMTSRVAGETRADVARRHRAGPQAEEVEPEKTAVDRVDSRAGTASSTGDDWGWGEDDPGDDEDHA